MNLTELRHSGCCTVSRERCAHVQGHLVIALKRLAELQHKTLENQLADLWELGVDDGDHCSIHLRRCNGTWQNKYVIPYVSEGGRRGLRLHARAHQKTSATH